MRLERIRTAVGAAWQSMADLYEAAFPLSERRTREEHTAVLARDDFHCMFLYDEGEMPLGLLTYWETQEFLYIEHFATLPEVRGHGYGREALRIMEESDRLLVLEAELPRDELTTRRVGFYRRAGFTENVHRHMQPPYHKGSPELEMRLMSYPREVDEEEYRRIYAYIWELVTGTPCYVK